MQSPHQHYLLMALEEARFGRGICAPNPAVGAVVVKDNHVLSKGYHHGPGLRHAEVEALDALGGDAAGATLYVTLEPCCHWGKTPPCTKRIIESGIKEVVFSYEDPNPVVAGRGAKELNGVGIPCYHVPTPELDNFYTSYRHWTLTGRPRVTAKLAMSLDGRIAGQGGRRIQITGEQLARTTHEMRREADAILTTYQTIEKDDPQMNVRLGPLELSKPVYVIDTRAELPVTARILSTARPLILFHGPDVSEKKLSNLSSRAVELREVKSEKGFLDLASVLSRIGEDGKHDLWVEAGGTLFEELALGNHLQRAFFYVAPRWLGSHAKAAFTDQISEPLQKARSVRWETRGGDALCEVEW